MKKTKHIIIIFMVLLCGVLLIPAKVIASTPAYFEIKGKTTLQQGEAVTFKIVVISGDALFFDGEVYFKGDAFDEDVFEFVSFDSAMGATYNSSTGQIYLTGEESLAVPVAPGDVIATITLKVKDNAKVGDIKWLEGSLLEQNLTITSKKGTDVDISDEIPKDTKDQNNSILYIIIVGLVAIISSLGTYIVISKKKI